MLRFFLLLLLLLPLVLLAQDPLQINALKEEASNKSLSESKRLLALHQLTIIHYYKDIKKAKKYAQEALALAQKDSSSIQMAEVYNNQALLSIGFGLYDLGIAQSVLAIQLAQKLEKPLVEAIANAQLSYIYSLKGYAQQAMDCSITAISLAEEQEDALSILTSYYYIAKSYYNLNEMDKALIYFDKAMVLAEQTQNTIITTFLDIEVGRCYTQKEEWNLAQEYIVRGLQNSEKNGIARGRAYAHYVLADWYNKQYLLEEASTNANKAITYYEKLEDVVGTAQTLQLLAQATASRGSAKEAGLHLDKALKIAKAARAMVLVQSIYQDLADFYVSTGNYQWAFDYYRKYHIVKDSIFNIDRNREITEIETKHNTQILAREKAELTEKTRHQALEIELRNERLQTQQLKNTQNSYIIIGLLAGLLLMIIIGLLIFRQDKLKTQIRETELEQRALRSQMNPHFMFNSLNSIQSLIATGNNSEASIYLAKFSRLMRRILQNSRQAYIPLRQEIEFLDNYIELEQRRFKEAFDYELDEEGIEDAHFVMIPPLVIQPFIENAIIHGLLRKSEKGTLLLKFEDYNNTFIKCTITDNGIGRKAAAAFKTDDNQESLGIKITEQRLHYLTIKQKITEPFVKVIDLTDEQGNPTGTQIELLLPTKLM